jgi:uncharacterized protein
MSDVVLSHRDPVLAAGARDALGRLGDLAVSLVRAAIVTDDGFEVAAHPERAPDGGRLASMSSAIQALGDAVTRELLGSGSQHLIIDSDQGRVVQRRVPGHPLVLVAVFTGTETTGSALAHVRVAAEAFARRLDAD